MTREINTCVLSSFLDATWTKPEEQATAVLGAALCTSSRFQDGLLRLVGLNVEGEVQVETEVQTGRGRDRIDVQLEVFNSRGGPEARVWIEVKVTAELMRTVEVEGGEERASREPQLTRYRTALDERDAVRPDVRKSILALLVPEPDAEDRRQAEATASKVLLWQEVGDLAAECARGERGGQWRMAAREPSATLELANLETLVWFLEAADRPGLDRRRDFVGIDATTEPVTKQIAEYYGASHQAVVVVAGLIERASDVLEKAGWQLGGQNADDASENLAEAEDDVTSDLTAEEFDLLNVVTLDEQIAPQPDTAWWSGAGNAAYFQARPFDEGVRPRSSEAVVQVGVSFAGAGGPFPTPAWLERLDVAGFASVEHRGAGAIAGIWKTKPFAWFIEPSSPSEQAKRLATWIDESLKGLMALSPKTLD